MGKSGKIVWAILVCFFILSGMFGFFLGLYYSKMANSGPRSCSNTFWMTSGTSNLLTKSGPVDLLTITKML